MTSAVTWNPVRQLWETEQADLFSEQQEPFSETWPTSGMTRSGRLLPLEMSAHPIGVNEYSSLLPTPNSGDSDGGGKVNNVSLNSTQATDGLPKTAQTTAARHSLNGTRCHSTPK